MNTNNLNQLDSNINDSNHRVAEPLASRETESFKSIKIIEPIKKCIKTFNTTDEFNLWYMKNKNEIDSLTTHKLNKLYHINGYRITKIKGELKLKKLPDKIINKYSIEDDNMLLCNREENEVLSHLRGEIENMKKDIQKIKLSIKEIINYINNMNKENIQT